ncbi:MAG: DUF4062 domain-containing protein [Fimbriimonadales bacterium]|nr:DUF4062 domain-containing protein [Fimbriimonadales bacterium]
MSGAPGEVIIAVTMGTNGRRHQRDHIVFVSSKIVALREERKELFERIHRIHGVTPWVFEHTTAHPDDPRNLYLSKVCECTIFILMDMPNESEAVLEELEEAFKQQKRIFVFVRSGTQSPHCKKVLERHNWSGKWGEWGSTEELCEQVEALIADELSRGLDYLCGALTGCAKLAMPNAQAPSTLSQPMRETLTDWLDDKLDEGNHEGAATQIRRFLADESNPDNVAYLRLKLAQVHRCAGRYPDALEEVSRGLEANSSYESKLRLSEAVLRADIGEPEKAEKILADWKDVETLPDRSRVLLYVLCVAHKYAEAMVLGDSLPLAQEQADQYDQDLFRGIAAVGCRRLVDGLRILRRLRGNSSKGAIAYGVMAEVMLMIAQDRRERRYARHALKHAEAALKHARVGSRLPLIGYKNLVNSANAVRVYAYTLLGEVESARAILGDPDVDAADPKMMMAASGLAMQEGRYNDAESLLRSVLGAEPRDEYACLNLAILLMRRGASRSDVDGVLDGIRCHIISATKVQVTRAQNALRSGDLADFLRLSFEVLEEESGEATYKAEVFTPSLVILAMGDDHNGVVALFEKYASTLMTPEALSTYAYSLDKLRFQRGNNSDWAMGRQSFLLTALRDYHFPDHCSLEAVFIYMLMTLQHRKRDEAALHLTCLTETMNAVSDQWRSCLEQFLRADTSGWRIRKPDLQFSFGLPALN